jgi:hypothetical protein
LPRLNVGVIDLVGDSRLRSLVSPTLLAQVAERPKEKYRSETAALLDDIQMMQRRLNPRVRLRSFRDRAQLQEQHADLSAQYSRLRLITKNGTMFPRPPVPGNDTIVPLGTPEELHQEGAEQQHCVGGYSQSVVAGHTYVYRILAPERATLSIVKGADGNWQVGQIALSCNRSASRETLRSVEQWLSSYAIMP